MGGENERKEGLNNNKKKNGGAAIWEFFHQRQVVLNYFCTRVLSSLGGFFLIFK